MAPTWLPPLNSHDQYFILVRISQSKEAAYHESHAANSLFLMNLRVFVEFISDARKNKHPSLNRSFSGLSLDVTNFALVCDDVTSASFAKEKIAETLYSFIPFELNKILCFVNHLKSNDMEEDNSMFALFGEDTGFVDKIWEFFCSMREKMLNEGKNCLPLELIVQKIVTLPDHELQAWNSWYDEKKRCDLNFERDFQEAISRERTEQELIDESTPAVSRGATKSSIENLEVVRLDCSSSRNFCSICQEELLMGSQATKLPCSHMFHGDCVVKWLQENHLCPYCRFSLPKL
ncbi:hypothetical protein ACH5RR_009626 [Cinchona calisaya]|uniref:RING-type domain-containing protein n=1 Tax=Cinchona calisaya TaxID=153742 RepID=A0ABD3AF84_9GENT